MARYEVTFSISARKELEHLGANTVRKLFPRIEALTGTPRHRGARKVPGYPNLWRIRIGDFRVIYTVDDDALLVD